jgi:lipoprotein-anchoring transpeptidase ErfK/SrfK
MESYPPNKTGAITTVFLAVYFDELNESWIGIHGTSLRDSIGKEASQGCIRMREEDVRNLEKWAVRDMVIWINEEPYKYPQ